MVLTVMMDTGDGRPSETPLLVFSGLLALEMVVMVTGDLARSRPPAASQALLFEVTVVGLGTIVMRGF